MVLVAVTEVVTAGATLEIPLVVMGAAVVVGSANFKGKSDTKARDQTVIQLSHP